MFHPEEGLPSAHVHKPVSQCVCAEFGLCGQHGRWSRSTAVLVARRAILFPGLAVGLAGWVSYFWMTHTHTHQTPCPLHHTLWDIIYDGSVTYGLFHHSVATASLRSALQHVVFRPPLSHLFSLISVSFSHLSFFSFSISSLLLFLLISLSQALTWSLQ